MKRPSLTLHPIPRLAFGLVGLVACSLLVLDLASPLLSDRTEVERRHRALVVTAASHEIGDNLLAGRAATARQQLDRWRLDDRTLRHAAARDAAGAVVAESGDDVAGDLRESVEIASPEGRWGRIDFDFMPAHPAGFAGWLQDDRLPALAALPLGLWLLVYLYLRRALTYLDPSTVVPERLRTAFDGLTEGVALLDKRGRIVLANRALRQRARDADAPLHGQPFEHFLQLELDQPDTAPWREVTATGDLRLGIPAAIGNRVGQLNCSPVTDADGAVRGCLVTFADETALARSNAELRAALAELNVSRDRIEQQNRQLTQLALYDGLTGLLNRRSFFEAAEAALRSCQDAGRPVTVLMLDIDHFKTFNDRYGHATGDAVLRQVAATLRDCMRQGDLIGRYGGEEFCGLGETPTIDGALAWAERLRARIEAESGLGVHEGADLRVTVSVGVMVVVPDPGVTTLAGTIKQADESLYAAKQGGRNRVVLNPSAAIAAASVATPTTA